MKFINFDNFLTITLLQSLELCSTSSIALLLLTSRWNVLSGIMIKKKALNATSLVTHLSLSALIMFIRKHKILDTKRFFQGIIRKNLQKNFMTNGCKRKDFSKNKFITTQKIKLGTIESVMLLNKKGMYHYGKLIMFMKVRRF